jgi:hypothetical protein
MEIKFELATEPAIKGTIAVVACVLIAYIATHSETPSGFASSFLIGTISIIIGTYKTPPLHAPTQN